MLEETMIIEATSAATGSPKRSRDTEAEALKGAVAVMRGQRMGQRVERWETSSREGSVRTLNGKEEQKSDRTGEKGQQNWDWGAGANQQRGREQWNSGKINVVVIGPQAVIKTHKVNGKTGYRRAANRRTSATEVNWDSEDRVPSPAPPGIAFTPTTAPAPAPPVIERTPVVTTLTAESLALHVAPSWGTVFDPSNDNIVSLATEIHSLRRLSELAFGDMADPGTLTASLITLSKPLESAGLLNLLVSPTIALGASPRAPPYAVEATGIVSLVESTPIIARQIWIGENALLPSTIVMRMVKEGMEDVERRDGGCQKEGWRESTTPRGGGRTHGSGNTRGDRYVTGAKIVVKGGAPVAGAGDDL
ncbi:hypothetical protein BDZ91DRAFT_800865 [Kalaharituber pfeilii]|nr:hypothetical protein BDZ91DRAFT_800865 [Kalaharituber pfeilii]